jgi:hypothetical protein
MVLWDKLSLGNFSMSAADSNPADSRESTRNPSWLFSGPSGTTRREVWQWWERRRYRYNRDLFLVGIATWLLVLIAGSLSVKPGVDFEEPLVMIIGPVFYAVCANIAYTAGPILDGVFYLGRPRKPLFKAGYVFSMILTALPGVWAVSAWISTSVTGKNWARSLALSHSCRLEIWLEDALSKAVRLQINSI